MKTNLLIAASASLLLGMSAAHAQDLVVGEEQYQSVCRNCHGPTAKGLASYPKLAGQPADYLTMRLEQYRAGETVSYNSPLMIPHAKNLSDDDITNLVAYIGTFD